MDFGIKAHDFLFTIETLSFRNCIDMSMLLNGGINVLV